MKLFSKYTNKVKKIKINKTNIYTCPLKLTTYQVFTLPFCLALAITSMCFIAALSIFFVTTVGIST